LEDGAGRPCLNVEFKDKRNHTNIIVTNVHFPHKIKPDACSFLNPEKCSVMGGARYGTDSPQHGGGDKKRGELFDKVMNSVIKKFNKSDRYIIGGDFNGVPEFANTMFKSATKLPKTCCWQGGHGKSDIIYDTSQKGSKVKIINQDGFRAQSHDIGKTSNGPKPGYYYGSDHLPVYLSNSNILAGGYNSNKSKKNKSKRNKSKRNKSKRNKSKKNKSKRK
jgi:hypothetical protein